MTVQSVRTARIVRHPSRESVLVVQKSDLAIKILHLLEDFGIRLHDIEQQKIGSTGRVKAMVVTFFKGDTENVRQDICVLSVMFRMSFSVL